MTDDKNVDHRNDSTNDTSSTESEVLLSSEDIQKISTMEPKLPKSTSENDDTPTSLESTPQTAVDSSSTASIGQDEQSRTSTNEDLKTSDSNAKASDYFADDEEFLRGDDVAVHSETDISLFKQAEGVISWEIINFYKDNGSPRSKLALRNDPPIMKISSSVGDSAEFLVTQNFAKSLGHVLKDVERAYYGMTPQKEKKPLTQELVKTKFEDFKQWCLEHPFKAAAAGLVLGLLIVSAFAL